MYINANHSGKNLILYQYNNIFNKTENFYDNYVFLKCSLILRISWYISRQKLTSESNF